MLPADVAGWNGLQLSRRRIKFNICKKCIWAINWINIILILIDAYWGQDYKITLSNTFPTYEHIKRRNPLSAEQTAVLIQYWMRQFHSIQKVEYIVFTEDTLLVKSIFHTLYNKSFKMRNFDNFPSWKLATLMNDGKERF